MIQIWVKGYPAERSEMAFGERRSDQGGQMVPKDELKHASEIAKSVRMIEPGLILEDSRGESNENLKIINPRCNNINFVLDKFKVGGIFLPKY